MIQLAILFVATPEMAMNKVAAGLRRGGYMPHLSLVHDPAALEKALRYPCDVIFVTPVAGEFAIEQVVATLRRDDLDIPCIVLSDTMPLAEVVRLGAQDCLADDRIERLVPTVERELVAAALRYNVREQIVTDHLLQEIDQYILRNYDMQNLVRRVCQRMMELFGFSLVWIGMKELAGAVDIAAAAGATEYLDGFKVRWDDTPLGQGTTGRAIRENRPVVLRIGDPEFAPWRMRAEKLGICKVLAMPLGYRGDVIGALMMYSRREADFDKLMVDRLSAFAARVAVAMLGAQKQQGLRLMEVAMNNAANAMFITDRNARVQWLNDALCRISGYAAERIIGQTPRIFSSGKHDAVFWRGMWDAILEGKPWRGEIVNRNNVGDLYTVTQSISPLCNDKGELTHFLAVQQDISEKRRLEEEIHHLAYHDILTDLPNRMLFQDRVQQEIARAKRSKAQFAVLFIDLDGFKAVNDTRGHATGDLLLQAIAARLRSCVREGDTVARLGGDEFTILLRDITPGAALQRVLHKIVQCVSQSCELGEYSASVTASIGVSLYPDDASGVEKLLIHADEAMYQAKRAGKNCFVFYSQPQGPEPC